MASREEIQRREFRKKQREKREAKIQAALKKLRSKRSFAQDFKDAFRTNQAKADAAIRDRRAAEKIVDK